MRRALLAAVLAACAGCGGGGEAAPSVSNARVAADPPPPLTYPPTRGAVPAWLKEIKPRRGLGSWYSALPSPDGGTLLAQWTGECEIPFAYFVPLDTRKRDGRCEFVTDDVREVERWQAERR